MLKGRRLKSPGSIKLHSLAGLYQIETLGLMQIGRPLIRRSGTQQRIKIKSNICVGRKRHCAQGQVLFVVWIGQGHCRLYLTVMKFARSVFVCFLKWLKIVAVKSLLTFSRFRRSVIFFMNNLQS